MTERGQVTIPKALRERFGMHPNVEIEITPTPGGILIRKAGSGERPVDKVYGILGKDALGKGVSVDDYIEEIRGSSGTTDGRIQRILAERADMHPVDRVSGILDHLDFDVDEYIEEIRGR